MSATIINQPQHRSIDLCCCAGGSSLGVEQAGFQVLLGIDISKNAAIWHRNNFPHIPVLQRAIADVSTEEILQITGLKVGELEHLHCSWPCIENSMANTKAASNPPANINRVFFDFYEKIQTLQPHVFTCENVDGALFGKKKKYFNELIRALSSLPNYTFKYKLMTAVYYGIPQNRRRLFIIGKRNDIAPGVEITFPEPDLERAKTLTLNKVLPYIKKYHAGQFGNKVIPAYNHYMCTIKANNTIEVFVEGKWRKISVEETKLLMGFPQNFMLPAARTTAMRLLGNAIPPPMMQAVMEHIKNTILIEGNKDGNTLKSRHLNMRVIDRHSLLP